MERKDLSRAGDGDWVRGEQGGGGGGLAGRGRDPGVGTGGPVPGQPVGGVGGRVPWGSSY